MTNPTRYGTSCAEHPEGCFVKFSEYEKVVAERDALRAPSESDIRRALVAWFDPLHPDQNDFMARMRMAIDAAQTRERS